MALPEEISQQLFIFTRIRTFHSLRSHPSIGLELVTQEARDALGVDDAIDDKMSNVNVLRVVFTGERLAKSTKSILGRCKGRAARSTTDRRCCAREEEIAAG